MNDDAFHFTFPIAWCEQGCMHTTYMWSYICSKIRHPAGTSEFCSFFEGCRSFVPCKYPLISFQSGHKLQK